MRYVRVSEIRRHGKKFKFLVVLSQRHVSQAYTKEIYSNTTSFSNLRYVSIRYVNRQQFDEINLYKRETYLRLIKL
jgi:hypothetical protein